MIEHSERTAAEIHFSNRDILPVAINAIDDYVSEEKNPENEKGVDFVKIFHPAYILENMLIVDTPGMGSVLPHNSETTKSFIPKIDAAIYVLSADIPIYRYISIYLNRILIFSSILKKDYQLET